MIGFFSGVGFILILSLAALIISARRPNEIIDNCPEMFEMIRQGVIKRHRKKLY